MVLHACCSSSTFDQLFSIVLYSDIPFHSMVLYLPLAVCVVFSLLASQNIKTCPFSHYLFSSFPLADCFNFLLNSLPLCTILHHFYFHLPVPYFFSFPISTIHFIFFFFKVIFASFLSFPFSVISLEALLLSYSQF